MPKRRRDSRIIDASDSDEGMPVSRKRMRITRRVSSTEPESDLTGDGANDDIVPGNTPTKPVKLKVAGDRLAKIPPWSAHEDEAGNKSQKVQQIAAPPGDHGEVTTRASAADANAPDGGDGERAEDDAVHKEAAIMSATRDNQDRTTAATDDSTAVPASSSCDTTTTDMAQTLAQAREQEANTGPKTPFRDTTTGLPQTPASPTRPINSITPSHTLSSKLLYTHPEIAERFVPQRSFGEGVTYRDPSKFSLKPAFWQRWRPDHYVNLAEHMRLQFDPVPFAQAYDLPVQEVNLIASRLVFNPLMRAKEAAERGEEGFNEMRKLYREYGTPSRPWCDGKVRGEFAGVAYCSVRLILDDRSTMDVAVRELGRADVKYLYDNMVDPDWIELWGMSKGEYLNKVEECRREKEAEEAKPGEAERKSAQEADELT